MGILVYRPLTICRLLPAIALQRHVAMLLRRIALVLVVRHLQGLHQLVAGVARQDNLVDVAAFGSTIGVVELLFVLLDDARLLFGGCLAVEDVHCSFGPHHGNLRLRIGQVDVSAGGFAGHHDVGAAVGLAGDERNLGHSGLGIGIDNLGAVADDAVVLLHGAGQEAGHVLERNNRYVEAVAEADEAGSLVAGIDVQDTGQIGGLVGHDAHGATVQAAEADDHILREVGHDLEEVLVVQHRLDDVLDVIGQVRVFGDDGLEGFRLAMDVVRAGDERRILHIVGGQEAEELADGHHRLLFVVAHEVGDAALRAMRIGAAQFFFVHHLVGDGLHHVRAGDEHVALLLHHEDEVGQRGGSAPSP